MATEGRVLPSFDDTSHPAWDEFTEMVSTIEDEVIGGRGILEYDFRHSTARDVVLFILRDDDMRALMVACLNATE